MPSGALHGEFSDATGMSPPHRCSSDCPFSMVIGWKRFLLARTLEAACLGGFQPEQ
jgi:hypothetical protein